MWQYDTESLAEQSMILGFPSRDAFHAEPALQTKLFSHTRRILRIGSAARFQILVRLATHLRVPHYGNYSLLSVDGTKFVIYGHSHHTRRT